MPSNVPPKKIINHACNCHQPQAQNILKQSKWTLKMSLLLILTCYHNEATAHDF
jgi:N-acetylmuramic acid 6-phosphate (MurNAc-6-P) etherase